MAILFQDTATGANGTDIGTRGYSPGGGGFASIQSNEYLLTFVGSAVWRARYNTAIIDDDFECYADLRRSIVAGDNGNPGLFFWYGEGGPVEFCNIHYQRQTDALVDIRFHRYDGAYQDPADLALGVPLAAGAQMRLGARMLNGVARGYRADPVTGANEVDLGVLSISVDWRDGAHRMFGLGNNYAGVSDGVTWDNITVQDYGGWEPPTPAPGLTSWGNC